MKWMMAAVPSARMILGHPSRQCPARMTSDDIFAPMTRMMVGAIYAGRCSDKYVL